MDTPSWWLFSSAWPRKKETKLAASETENTTPAKTASLAHSTGRRRGTAVSEDRIMPVLYSPLIISTPSTPKATTANDHAAEADADRVEAGPVGWAEGVVLAGGHRREQRADADHQDQGHQQGPDGGAQRTGTS